MKCRNHGISISIAATAAIVLCPALLCAVEVSTQMAERAAKRWLAENPSPMDSRLAWCDRGETKTVYGEGGQALFHVVEMEDGGYVVMSGDTTIMPVVAFSGSGACDISESSPLRALLERDMATRRSAAESAASGAVLKKAKASAGAAVSLAESEWERLCAQDEPGVSRKSAKASGAAAISDVRVSPLVKSKWSQGSITSLSLDGIEEVDVFNLYIPNHYVAGCVATALAQIMRYWQYPVDAVAPRTYKCRVNGVLGSYTMLGGVYDWSLMPLEPDADCSAAEKEALSRLTYDVSVASRMDWGEDGSSSWGEVGAAGLQDAFGYAYVRTLNNLSETVTKKKNLMTVENYRNALLASLDGGMPAVVGMDGPNGGHEAVVDGYGFNGDANTVYCHMNFGWEGEDDMWYNLIGEGITDDYAFNVIDDVLYNINPAIPGDVISGRVLDSAGAPVANIVVSATAQGGFSATATTSSAGVYAIRIPGKGTYSLSASDATLGSASRSVVVSKDSSNVKYVIEEGANENGFSIYDFPASNVGVVANKWGEDLTLSGGTNPDEDTEPEDAEPEEGYAAGTVNATYAKAQTLLSVLYDAATGAVAGSVQIKFGKKSKKNVVKVSGTAALLNGKKVTAKAVSVNVGSGSASETLVFKAPVGSMAFAVSSSGRVTLSNASYVARAAYKGVGGKLDATTMYANVEIGEFNVPDGYELLEDALPENVKVTVKNGTKWSTPAAPTLKYKRTKNEDGSVSYALSGLDDEKKPNLSGLKLSYTAKTGAFKGSFKLYATNEGSVAAGKAPKLKKYTVNVNGLVVDGVAYGQATCKKPAAGPWIVTVK